MISFNATLAEYVLLIAVILLLVRLTSHLLMRVLRGHNV